MKFSLVLFLTAFFLGSLAAKTTQTDANASKLSPAGTVGDGKIVMNQLCNTGSSNEDISSLKKELEMLRKELGKNGTKALSLRVVLLGKQVETLGNELKQRMDQIQQKDPWIKLNSAPVCFVAKGDQFGKFSVPSGGSLLSIKLVHLHGYVSCAINSVNYWSYWGCGTHSSVKDHVDVLITTSANHILLPPSQFITNHYKWSKIPGYNSLSPELVLSVFSSPLTVTSGQELRLWYGEDLLNNESDNGGTSCCDVFARFM
ncbi:hypothetical protein ACROYT_G033475 [Oculina patagonica]